jgi:hypothetical protein
METTHLDSLEHNTYIKYGFVEGPLKFVTDPESEQAFGKMTFLASFDALEMTQNHMGRKHKQHKDHEIIVSSNAPKGKHTCLSPRFFSFCSLITPSICWLHVVCIQLVLCI